MKTLTYKLNGLALEWAVAKAAGYEKFAAEFLLDRQTLNSERRFRYPEELLMA